MHSCRMWCVFGPIICTVLCLRHTLQIDCILRFHYIAAQSMFAAQSPMPQHLDVRMSTVGQGPLAARDRWRPGRQLSTARFG